MPKPGSTTKSPRRSSVARLFEVRFAPSQCETPGASVADSVARRWVALASAVLARVRGVAVALLAVVQAVVVRALIEVVVAARPVLAVRADD